METQELISKLADNEISLSVRDSDLKISYDQRTNISQELINEIKTKKDELIEYFLKYNDQSNYDTIEQVPVDLDYPVSYGQQRLWISSQFPESSKAYNIIIQLRMQDMDCNVINFDKSLFLVVKRHEILRTVFRENLNGELRQIVLSPETAFKGCRYENLENSGDEKIKTLFEAENNRLFDLSKGPLFVAGLIKLRNNRSIIYFNIHHIVADGVSIDLLSKEVTKYYESFEKGNEPIFQPLKLQYKDYSSWQIRKMSAGRFEKDRLFWVEQLSGPLPVISLPSVKLRPPLMTHNGRGYSAVIDKNEVQKMNYFCASNHGTLFMGLIAVFNILIYRYTGDQDIIIGIPVAGREHHDLEYQIGFYVNTLPLRIKLKGIQSFSELFALVRETTANIYQHQQYPFNKLVEDLSLVRDVSRSPIFDISLVFQNQQDENDILSTQILDRENIIDSGICKAKFDLLVSFREKAGDLYIQVEFNTDVYENNLIGNFIKHYRELLTSALISPSKPIDQLKYLSEIEIRQLMDAGKSDQVRKLPEETIIDLFYKQVYKTPNQHALSFEGEHLTYKDLDNRSNQLAHYLRKKNVKAGTLIPVCMDRSFFMVISILGILKAGAAYVPIDPAYPAYRVRYLLNDLNAEYLIAQSQYSELFEDQMEVFKLFVDRDWIAVEAESVQSLGNLIQPDNLAYIIYTSGSTGHPKGVMIEHRQLYNYLCYCKDQYMGDFDTAYIVPLFTSISFDLTITSLFGVLVSGGKLVIYPQHISISDLLSDIFYGSNGINFVKLTPTHVEILKGMDKSSTKIAQVVVGGEELRHHHLKELFSVNKSVKVYNEYGPTEATVGCIVQKFTDELENSPVPIGCPIPNTEVYILDANLRLIPIGITGEIYLGGIQLARGYFNKEDLTMKNFIENPFREGERLYRTGDIGKWIEDYRIIYAGRIDDQVKIRGNRVELGEVEHSISKITGVEAVTVIMDKEEDGQSYLSAYVVSKEEVRHAEVRAQLLQFLPEYMVPEYIIQLDYLPLTTNGKIDRKALPSPKSDDVKAGREYQAPCNETELKLIEILKEIFNDYDKISMNMDFFELGGNSLKAISLYNKLNKSGYLVSLDDILNNSIIKNLATKMAAVKKEIIVETESNTQLLKPHRNLFPLSYNQKSYCSDNEVEHAYGNFNFKIDKFNKEKFVRAYKTMIVGCEILRTRIFFIDGKIYQDILPENEIEYDIQYFEQEGFDLRNDKTSANIEEFLKKPFDLLNGHTIKCGVLYVGLRAYILVSIHHIVTDHLSNIAIKKILTNLCMGKDKIPAIGSYHQFISLQIDYLNSAVGKKKLSFWMSQLESISREEHSYAKLELRRQGKAVISNMHVISGKRFREFKSCYTSKNIFLSSAILGCFVFLIVNGDYADDEFIIDAVSEGQYMDFPDFNIKESLGQFTNSVPLKFSSNILSSGNFIREVQEVYLRALQNQEIPAGFIQESFIAKYSFSYSLATSFYFNYLDYKNDSMNVIFPNEGNIKRRSWLRMDDIKNKDTRLAAKCCEYSDGMVINWDMYCDENKTKYFIENNNFIKQLDNAINYLSGI